jgi:hypothetical protein
MTAGDLLIALAIGFVGGFGGIVGAMVIMYLWLRGTE